MSKFESFPGAFWFVIWLLVAGIPFAGMAQQPKPAAAPPVKAPAENVTKPRTPPAKPAAAATKPAAAPELRATPPTVTEVTDPNAPGAPAPPAQINPLLPEGTYNPFPSVVPGLFPMPLPGALPPSKPPLQRMYPVTKFVIKYGTDVRARYPKLPTEEELAAATVSLLEVRGSLYHPGKKPAATPPAAGEQAGRADQGDLDQALHPPAVQSAAPVPGGKPPETPDGKPGTKPTKDPGAKPGKNVPKAIPKPFVQDKPTARKLAAFGEPKWISAMGLIDVYDSIVRKLTDRGLIGVYLKAAIDPRTGVDLRAGTLDVEIKVFVSEVAKIRTIHRKLPFRLGDLPRLNDDDAPDGETVKDPEHLWIKAKSPVFAFAGKKGSSGLLEKRRLQDYLSRLNRFPGRRVDAAINATGEEGKVMLDYLIREQKPFMIYAQTTNNGVPSTGDWRSRVGIEYRQLANMDDILRMEYITTDLQRFNSGILSYQFALDKPDVLKMRVYGLYGDFSAEDVGFAGANFKGDSLTAGAAITWTPLYWRGFPLDLTLGAEFLRVSVENEASGLASNASFVLPYIGVGTERTTDRFSLATNWQVKGSFGGPSQDALNGLGRFDTDGGFWILNGEIAGSAYLEPLIFGKKWGDVEGGKKWWRGMLANEVAILARGQYAMGNRRLIPQLEFIAGGFNTIRGYPESFTAGDSGILGSFEYRLHLSRLLKPGDAREAEKEAAKQKAAGDAAGKPKEKKIAQKKPADAGPRAPAQPDPVVTDISTRGGRVSPFKLRPATSGTGADWEAIVRLFADYGQTFNNRAQPVIEVDRTMFSAGAGLELQLFKPIYMTIRADYGFVLQSQSELLVDPIDFGDSRVHISATIAW